jgi:DNA (cytosine-5)-methyltransferase 1
MSSLVLKPALKVLSLFAGCGGSSLGYKLAGGQVVAAVERDPHAVQIYRANHPETLLLDGDITTLAPVEIMAQLALQAGELDILDGSPPCQGFSLAGKRQVQDPRNRLFEEYVRFLEAFQPKAFVMENVPGLVTGKMRGLFHEMIQALQGVGYRVSARILNAAHYGVPQARRRVIVVGIRQDLGLIPRHPVPETHAIGFQRVIQGLNEPGLVQVPVGRALAIAKALKPGESGADLHEHYQQKGHDFSLQRLSWHKPSPTVCKTIRAGQCGLLHPEEDRFLSIGELKRVCSFPDDYVLFGTFEQQWGRLGNAVPPLLMKAVAQSVMNQLKGVDHASAS